MGSYLSKLCSGCTESKKKETAPKGLEVDEEDRDCNKIATPESICLDEKPADDVTKIANDTDQNSGLCAISGVTGEIPVQDLEREPHLQLTEHDVKEKNISEAPAYGVYISQLIRHARACSSYDDFVSRGRSLTAKLTTQGYTKDKLKNYDFKAERHGPKHIEPRITDDNGPYGPSSFSGNKEEMPSGLNDEKPIVYYTAPKENKNFRHQNENGEKDKKRSPSIKRQGDSDSSDTRLKTADRSKDHCPEKPGKKKRKKQRANSADNFHSSGFTGNGPARKKRVQSATDSSDSSDTESSSSSESEEEEKHENKRKEKKSSSTKVYKAVNMQFGKHNKIINQKIKRYSSDDKKKSSKRKHKHKPKETFTTDKPRTTGKGPNFCLNKENAVTIKNREIIVNAAKSVGIIRGPKVTGTGFRVGDNFVMTALHVVENFLDGNGRLQNSCSEQLSIQFDYKEAHMQHIQNKTFFFEQKVVYQNKDLDTVVLQVKADANKILPDALRIFNEVSSNLCLIGHPGGHVLQDDTQLYVWPRNQEVINEARIWSIQNFGKDGYQGIERESRVLFHTSFAHGASGAPGMHIDEITGTSVVTAMLLRGYPDFCFANELSEEKLNSITNNHRIEEGITMKHICQAMKANGLNELSHQIFGHFFDGRS